MTRNNEEEEHCIAYAEWCRLQANVIPELRLVMHVPNGGVRPYKERIGPEGRMVRYSVEGQKLKRMGAKKGVWDYFIPVGRGWMGAFRLGAWIEFKSKDGELSKEQAEFGAAMEQQGYLMYMTRDWEQAKRFTIEYLGFPAGAVVNAKRQ